MMVSPFSASVRRRSFERRQSRDRDRAGVPQVKPLGDRCDLVSGHDDIFSVEAAFRVFRIGNGTSSPTFSHLHPHPTATTTQNRRSRALAENAACGARNTLRGRRRPTGRCRQYRRRSRLHRHPAAALVSMTGDHLRSAELIDGCGEHGAGDMHHAVLGKRGIAGAIEHGGYLVAWYLPAWTRLPAATMTSVNFVEQMR